MLNKHDNSKDSQKTTAITEMQPTTAFTQMKRISPMIAELLQPLCKLLSAKKAWMQGPPQQESFEKVKTEIRT